MTVLDDLREPGAGVGDFPPTTTPTSLDARDGMPVPAPTYLDEDFSEESSYGSGTFRLNSMESLGEQSSPMPPRRLSSSSSRLAQAARAAVSQARPLIPADASRRSVGEHPSWRGSDPYPELVEPAPPRWCHQALRNCVYYFVSFFVLWFGPAMFDTDCDGDFDANDVDNLLQAKFGMNPPKKVVERRELRSLRGLLKAARKYSEGLETNDAVETEQAAGNVVGAAQQLEEGTETMSPSLKRSATQATSGKKPGLSRSQREVGKKLKRQSTLIRVDDSMAVEAVVERCLTCASRNDSAGAHTVIKEMLRTMPAHSFTVARALADPRLSGYFKFEEGDKGDIDLTDIMDIPLPGLVDEHRTKKIQDGQAKPIFIVFQCIVCLLLWVVMALVYPLPNSSKYGLDSLVPGCFDLRLYELSDPPYDGCDLLVTADKYECRALYFQVWRWLLYQYTHMSFGHVFFNCILALILGIPLEGLEGTPKLCLFFQAGVLGGAWCAFLTSLRTPVVGMSGGCYALFGMHFADLLTNWDQKKFRWTVLLFLCSMFSVDMLLYYFSESDSGAPSKSHMTHLGGVIAGAITAICFGRNVVILKWERWLIAACFVVGAGLSGFSLYWAYAVFPPRPLFPNLAMADPSEKPWCWAHQVFDPNQFEGQTEFECVRCSYPGCIERFSRPNVWESYAVSIQGCDTGRGGAGLWNDKLTAKYDCPGPSPCPSA